MAGLSHLTARLHPSKIATMTGQAIQLAHVEVRFSADGRGRNITGGERLPMECLPYIVTLEEAGILLYTKHEGQSDLVVPLGGMRSARKAGDFATVPTFDCLFQMEGLSAPAAEATVLLHQAMRDQLIFPYGNERPDFEALMKALSGARTERRREVDLQELNTLKTANRDLNALLDKNNARFQKLGVENRALAAEINRLRLTTVPMPSLETTQGGTAAAVKTETLNYDGRKAELEVLRTTRGRGDELRTIYNGHGKRASTSKTDMVDQILAIEFPDTHPKAA